MEGEVGSCVSLAWERKDCHVVGASGSLDTGMEMEAGAYIPGYNNGRVVQWPLSVCSRTQECEEWKVPAHPVARNGNTITWHVAVHPGHRDERTEVPVGTWNREWKDHCVADPCASLNKGMVGDRALYIPGC